MKGTLRATPPGRAGRTVPLAAVLLTVTGVAALAGCAVPGIADEPLASPPASARAARQAAQGGPAAPVAPTPPPRAVPLATPAVTATPRVAPSGPGATSEPVPSASRTPGTAEQEEPEAPPPGPSRTVSSPPSASPSAPGPSPRTTPPELRTGDPGERSKDGSTTLRIGSWSAKVVRGGQDAVDACRDAVQWTGPDLGTEDGYALRTAVVVGHEHCGGFDRFAELPVGTVVTAVTPRGTFTYRVYARHVSPGRGTPSHGLYWGDLTLQSCVGDDTGFSYLVRV